MSDAPTDTTIPCTLEEVLYYVRKYYPFVFSRYPALRPNGMNGMIAQGGVLDHTLMHLTASTMGPLARIVEVYHHTETVPDEAREVVLKALAKALVNVSAIAETFNISADELCRTVPEVMKPA